MAYATKFITEWASPTALNRVRIERKDFIGPAQDLTPDRAGIEITWGRQNGQYAYAPLMISAAQIPVRDFTAGGGILSEVFDAEDTDYRVVYERAERDAAGVPAADTEGSPVYTEHWSGYLATDFYEDDPFSSGGIIRLEALDGLALLSERVTEFDDLTQTLWDTAHDILSGLGLAERYRVGMEWYPYQETAGGTGAAASTDNCPLDWIRTGPEAFYVENEIAPGESPEMVDQRETLESILIRFGCELFQYGGEWHIRQPHRIHVEPGAATNGSIRLWTDPSPDGGGGDPLYSELTAAGAVVEDLRAPLPDLIDRGGRPRRFVGRLDAVSSSHVYEDLGELVLNGGFEQPLTGYWTATDGSDPVPHRRPFADLEQVQSYNGIPEPTQGDEYCLEVGTDHGIEQRDKAIITAGSGLALTLKLSAWGTASATVEVGGFRMSGHTLAVRAPALKAEEGVLFIEQVPGERFGTPLVPAGTRLRIQLPTSSEIGSTSIVLNQPLRVGDTKLYGEIADSIDDATGVMVHYHRFQPATAGGVAVVHDIVSFEQFETTANLVTPAGVTVEGYLLVRLYGANTGQSAIAFVDDVSIKVTKNGRPVDATTAVALREGGGGGSSTQELETRIGDGPRVDHPRRLQIGDGNVITRGWRVGPYAAGEAEIDQTIEELTAASILAMQSESLQRFTLQFSLSAGERIGPAQVYEMTPPGGTPQLFRVTFLERSYGDDTGLVELTALPGGDVDAGGPVGYAKGKASGSAVALVTSPVGARAALKGGRSYGGDGYGGALGGAGFPSLFSKSIANTGPAISVRTTAATADTIEWTKITGKPPLVETFNERYGAVALTDADVTTALGYTPLSESSADLRYVNTDGDVMTGNLAIGDPASPAHLSVTGSISGVLANITGKVTAGSLDTNPALVQRLALRASGAAGAAESAYIQAREKSASRAMIYGDASPDGAFGLVISPTQTSAHRASIVLWNADVDGGAPAVGAANFAVDEGGEASFQTFGTGGRIGGNLLFKPDRTEVLRLTHDGQAAKITTAWGVTEGAESAAPLAIYGPSGHLVSIRPDGKQRWDLYAGGGAYAGNMSVSTPAGFPGFIAYAPDPGGAATDVRHDLYADGEGWLASMPLRVDGYVGSPAFATGWTGAGWRISEGGDAELQNLSVRGTAIFRDLEIRRLRYSKGEHVFGPGGGKLENVYTYEDNGERKHNLRTVEPHGLTAGALVLIQRADATGAKQVRLRVFRIDDARNFGVINETAATASDGTFDPVTGDHVAAVGHTTAADKDSTIYVNPFGPFLDVTDGVSSFADWDGIDKIRVRLGALDGITYEGRTLSGHGLYSENVYLRGEIVAEKGRIAEVYIGENLSSVDDAQYPVMIGNWRAGLPLIRVRGAAGGVQLLHENESRWGLEAFTDSGESTVQLGSVNQIAGWQFDAGKFWTGYENIADNTAPGVYLSLSTETESVGAESGTNLWYRDRAPAGLKLSWHRANNAGHLVFGQLASSGTGTKAGFFGLQMMDYEGREFFALSADTNTDGATSVYNRIAAFNFNDERIYGNNTWLGRNLSAPWGQTGAFVGDFYSDGSRPFIGVSSAFGNMFINVNQGRPYFNAYKTGDSANNSTFIGQAADTGLWTFEMVAGGASVLRADENGAFLRNAQIGNLSITGSLDMSSTGYLTNAGTDWRIDAEGFQVFVEDTVNNNRGNRYSIMDGTEEVGGMFASRYTQELRVGVYGADYLAVFEGPTVLISGSDEVRIDSQAGTRGWAFNHEIRSMIVKGPRSSHITEQELIDAGIPVGWAGQYYYKSGSDIAWIWWEYRGAGDLAIDRIVS